MKNRVFKQEPIKWSGKFFSDRKINVRGTRDKKNFDLYRTTRGARDPDRRLDPDPGYAFQGVKISCVPELSLLGIELFLD